MRKSGHRRDPFSGRTPDPRILSRDRGYIMGGVLIGGESNPGCGTEGVVEEW